MDKFEKQIQSSIINRLKKIEGVIVFAHTSTPFSPTGHPDIYGSVLGYSFWGEVKCPGRKLTLIQSATLDRLGMHTIFTNIFVWHSAEQAVKDILRLRDCVNFS